MPQVRDTSAPVFRSASRRRDSSHMKQRTLHRDPAPGSPTSSDSFHEPRLFRVQLSPAHPRVVRSSGRGCANCWLRLRWMSSTKRPREGEEGSEVGEECREEEEEGEEDEGESSSHSSTETGQVSGQGWNRPQDLITCLPVVHPQEVEVDFEVRPITKDHHHAIRRLLQQVLCKL